MQICLPLNRYLQQPARTLSKGPNTKKCESQGIQNYGTCLPSLGPIAVTAEQRLASCNTDWQAATLIGWQAARQTGKLRP
eukprot:1153219-Pelagomonas_calceolata.AAC.5